MSTEKIATYQHLGSLHLDRLHFFAARDALKAAQEYWPKLKKAIDESEEKELRRAMILVQHDNNWTAAQYDLENEGLLEVFSEEELGKQYCPLLKNLVLTHVLCACSLEAHINLLADRYLENGQKEEFERIPLAAKWLFLPRICGYTEIEAPDPLYLGLLQLVARRNMFAHFKQPFHPIDMEAPVAFLEQFGLTLEAAARSVDLTEALIKTIDKNFGIQGSDYWIESEEHTYFAYDMRKKEVKVPTKSKSEIKAERKAMWKNRPSEK